MKRYDMKLPPIVSSRLLMVLRWLRLWSLSRGILVFRLLILCDGQGMFGSTYRKDSALQTLLSFTIAISTAMMFKGPSST